MKKTILTDANVRFIKKNRLKMSGTDMAQKFGVSKSVVNCYMYNNGLSVPNKLQIKFRTQKSLGKSIVTIKDDNYIKKNYLKIPVKTLAKKLGYGDGVIQRRIKMLGLVVPKELIEQRKKASQIQPGSIPVNKGKKIREYMSPDAVKKVLATTFKAGHLPHNAVGFNDGDISIRYDHKKRGGKAYKYIRLSLGKWYPLHQYKWELKNGKIPAGHCLWFKDEDSMNTDLKNLELITRAENMKRNSCSLRLTDGYVAQTIAGKNGKHIYDEILKRKDLIEVKRLQLQLNRQIKQYQNAQQR